VRLADDARDFDAVMSENLIAAVSQRIRQWEPKVTKAVPTSAQSSQLVVGARKPSLWHSASSGPEQGALVENATGAALTWSRPRVSAPCDHVGCG
jgi:hypothetical protein